MKRCKSLLWLLLAFPAGAEDLDGRQIMEKVREMRRSQDSETEMVMTIKTGHGERVREIRSFAKSYGDVDKSLMRFLSPTDVKGAGFLVWGQPGRADDQWLYLPELKRIKKIAASTRNGSFMGSDFSYHDLEDRSVDEADHSLLRREACQGGECFVVESVDKGPAEAVYSKSLTWVRTDNFVPVQSQLFDKKGFHLKTATFELYEQVKKIWVARKITMENLKKGTKTVMEVRSIKIDEGIGDEYFSQRYLQRED